MLMFLLLIFHDFISTYFLQNRYKRCCQKVNLKLQPLYRNMIFYTNILKQENDEWRDVQLQTDCQTNEGLYIYIYIQRIQRNHENSNMIIFTILLKINKSQTLAEFLCFTQNAKQISQNKSDLNKTVTAEMKFLSFCLQEKETYKFSNEKVTYKFLQRKATYKFSKAENNL